MCIVLLSSGDNPITVNKYIISHHITHMADTSNRTDNKATYF